MKVRFKLDKCVGCLSLCVRAKSFLMLFGLEMERENIVKLIALMNVMYLAKTGWWFYNSLLLKKV